MAYIMIAVMLSVGQALLDDFCLPSRMNKPDADEIVKTTFRIPKSKLKEVKQFGLDNEKTDTEIFLEALEEYLERHDKK